MTDTISDGTTRGGMDATDPPPSRSSEKCFPCNSMRDEANTVFSSYRESDLMLHGPPGVVVR